LDWLKGNVARVEVDYSTVTLDSVKPLIWQLVLEAESVFGGNPNNPTDFHAIRGVVG